MRKFTAGIALAAAIGATTAVAPVVTAAPAVAVEAGVNQATIKDSLVPAEYYDKEWRAKIAGFNNDRVTEITAYSPSMNRDIPVVLIKADQSAGPRPTIYLLNGAGGGEQRQNWIQQTDAIQFYLDKNVNVVIPMRGAFSYYTDWVNDPAPSYYLKGPQKWETFLTKELPGPVEDYLGASGRRAVLGMSMSATSSLLLAEHSGDLYHAVGSFSGCASTSDPITWEFLRVTVNRGDQQPETMWGPLGGEVNRYNDALLNSEGLRGKAIYVSNASGLSSDRETSSYLARQYNLNASDAFLNSAVITVEGGLIEGATNVCTHNLKAKLDREGIAADFNFRPTGVHTWTYWNQDLIDSWPTISRGLEIS
ncbi:alpha/beta hydrolase family protein [Corynebacterium sp. SCR221107]|uniref:alpha/beta hydrolase n=1 Tax=Corynebacterium sp. SCR221107 TaxID=3017361 RepID=UPI0022EC8AE8|nr:alpha/beta hydrolase family protein [Corynebacterium sp. SCR221107]WBT09817.1 alpha/beta hydrolase family protein [Corynebacterium sp. SCR221107]